MPTFLVFSTKDLVGYRMRISEPIRPYAINYLAASGLFESVRIETSNGEVVYGVEGSDLLKAADIVGVLPRK